MPDSSKKTSQADLRTPLFDPWPLVGHPARDRLLVTLAGLAFGPLQAPAQPPNQQPPHRRPRQAHPRDPLDHLGHPLQGPEVSGEPIGLGALPQRLLDLAGLRIRQLGRPASGPAATQRRHPALGQQGLPTPHALARDSHRLGHLGLGAALGQQFRCAQPAGLSGLRTLHRLHRAGPMIALVHAPMLPDRSSGRANQLMKTSNK
jgi:hypothetical protein